MCKKQQIHAIVRVLTQKLCQIIIIGNKIFVIIQSLYTETHQCENVPTHFSATSRLEILHGEISNMFLNILSVSQIQCQ